MSDPTKAFLGCGLKFPVQTDPLTGRFAMSEGEADIQEAVGIILNTSRGSRVMRPDFGCSLQRFVFGMTDYTSMQQMEHEIRSALTQWEPRITDIQVQLVRTGEEGRLNIHIHYRVRSTNNTYNLVYPYYISE